MFFLALKDLLSRRSRFALTSAGVGLAVAMFMAIFASVDRYVRQSKLLGTLLGTTILVQQAGAPSPFSSFLDPQVITHLEALPHVEGAYPAVITRVRAYGTTPIIVVGFQTEGFLATRVPLVSGRTPQPGKQELMVGAALAQRLKLRPGDEVTLRGLDFEVVGIYRTELGVLDAGGLTDLPSAQTLGNLGDALSFVLLDVAPGKESATVSAARQHLNGVEALATQEYMGTLGVFRVTSAFLSILSFVIVLMASLGVANVLQSALNERRSEFAMLRALGWSPWRLAKLILMEVALLAFAGTVAGFIGALGTLKLVATFGQEAIRSSGVLAKSVPLRTLLSGSCLAFAACFAGALPPLWRALRVPPWEGLRSL